MRIYTRTWWEPRTNLIHSVLLEKRFILLPLSEYILWFAVAELQNRRCTNKIIMNVLARLGSGEWEFPISTNESEDLVASDQSRVLQQKPIIPRSVCCICSGLSSAGFHESPFFRPRPVQSSQMLGSHWPTLDSMNHTHTPQLSYSRQLTVCCDAWWWWALT